VSIARNVLEQNGATPYVIKATIRYIHSANRCRRGPYGILLDGSRQISWIPKKGGAYYNGGAEERRLLARI